MTLFFVLLKNSSWASMNGCDNCLVCSKIFCSKARNLRVRLATTTWAWNCNGKPQLLNLLSSIIYFAWLSLADMQFLFSVQIKLFATFFHSFWFFCVCEVSGYTRLPSLHIVNNYATTLFSWKMTVSNPGPHCHSGLACYISQLYKMLMCQHGSLSPPLDLSSSLF